MSSTSHDLPSLGLPQTSVRPSAGMVLSTANREWTGFNPSPFSVRYFSADELRDLLNAAGFSVTLRASFPEQPSALHRIVGVLRRAAVALHLIPRTMAGKALLKRLFYGQLEPIPGRLDLSRYTPAALVPLDSITDLSPFRVLYAEATK